MYGKRRPMHTEPEPQRFQAIIQVWYKSGSSKANFFASKETAWLRQCASDFIALELPSPSQASSTCCSAECKIQVAWNVEAKDDLIRRLKTSFNPSTAVQRERGLTKEKLDSLEIYQMFLLKRWLKPSGDESLTGMGFARSSKATRDKHEASMANALPSTSFVLLTPTLPLEINARPCSRRSSFPTIVLPRHKDRDASSTSTKPRHANTFPPAIPPASSTCTLPGPSSSSLLCKPSLSDGEPCPSPASVNAREGIRLASGMSSMITAKELIAPPSPKQSTSVFEEGELADEDQPLLSSPNKGGINNEREDNDGPPAPTSDVEMYFSNPPADPLKWRKRSSSEFSSDTPVTPSTLELPSSPSKRVEFNDSPAQSIINELRRKCESLELRLQWERHSRAAAEDVIHMFQQTHQTDTLKIDELQAQVQLAHEDVEAKKKKMEELQEELMVKDARLQTAETAVASLRLEAEQEKREADVLQRKLITSDARLETLQLAITRLEQRVEQAKCDADDQACELERVRIKNERLRQEAQRLEHDAETQQHQLDAFLSGMKVVTEAHEKEMDTLRQELDVQRNESAAVTCAMKDTHEMEMNILRQEVEVQQRKADCYGLEMEALKATREKEIGVLEREMQHQQRQLVQYGSDLELTAEELEHVRSELQDAKSHLDSTKEDLELARSERDQEQILRMESDGVVEDMRRECRAPFVVPALVNAFAEMSKVTTRAKRG